MYTETADILVTSWAPNNVVILIVQGPSIKEAVAKANKYPTHVKTTAQDPQYLLSFVNLQIPYMFLQSHSFIMHGNRRFSLAALPGLPAASRGVKLLLLVNTRSVF